MKFETNNVVLEIDSDRKKSQNVDSITHSLKRAWEKPQIRRKIKWGAVVFLLLNILLVPIFSYFLVARPTETQAAPISQYSGGLLVYADTTNVGTPKYKVFDDSTGFGAEQSMTSVGSSAIEWLRVAASPVNDEWIIVTRDAGDVLKAQVCTGIDGGVSCGSATTITATAGTHGLRNFDIAYEQQSTGQAVLVYGTSTVDVLRKIEWTGGAWVNDAAITTTRTSGTVEWVELTARNNSDQIGIAYSDSNDDVSAYRWNGTAVADEAPAAVTTISSPGNVRKFDVSFEHTSGDMFVGALYTTAGALYYKALSGTTWSASTAVTTPDMDTEFLDLPEQAYVAPGDNDLSISTHGNLTVANTTEGYTWNGSAISDGTAGDDVGQLFSATTDMWQISATAFFNATYYGVTVISSTVSSTDDIEWWTMNGANTITDQTVNTRTRGASRFIDLFDYPNTDKTLLITGDANSDLWADTWAGGTGSAAWTDITSSGALETNLASSSTDMMDFAFRLAPAANSSPTLNIDTPASDTDIAETANYTIQYDLADSDSVATVDFYYETDGNGTGGTAISACQNRAEGTNATCQFTPSTEGMALTTYYYIYGVASDGVTPDVVHVSTGRIRRNAAPTLVITDPDGAGDTVVQGNTYNIYFSLGDTDSTVTVDLYYDTDGSGLNGTAITACQNLSEATPSCGWDTTSIPYDTYYIYGRGVNDGVNAEVTGYSPGEITVQSSNQNPNIPSNLGSAGYIDASSWINDNTPSFNFDITDPDSGQQVKYRVQIDDTAGFGSVVVDYTSGLGPQGTFSFTVGQAAGGGSYTVGTQGQTLSDAAGYYWRVKAIDAAAAESSYEEAGVDGTIDFRLDATGPTGLSVYDGTVVGVDQDNSGTALNSMAANWSAANFNVSGAATPNKYQYAIGTTFGGTNILDWTSTNVEGAVVTVSNLNINTSTVYYWTVKAADLAGNVTTISSNGQLVLPTLSFSVDTPTITFTDLSNSNNWTDIKQTNITTQTNAQGGYSVQGRIPQLLTEMIASPDTIANWTGTYASPASWAGTCAGNSQCGFGYTSSDGNITTGSRGNMYNSGTNYCSYSLVGAGDVVADNGGPTVDGSRNLINEIFTLTHKVSVNQNQTAGKYQTTLMLLVTSNF